MDQASYFRSHPPRCIAGFVARPAELPGVLFDGHVSMSQLNVDVPPGVTIHAPEHINPVFALSCQCGGDRHYVHCYRWTNPDYHNAVVTLSPLALDCAVCRKITQLLETEGHGYDSELGQLSATARAKGDRVVFECSDCGRQPFEAFVRFEYPDDLFDGDFPEFAGREQDLFTWFSLVGKCPKCSQPLAVADFECACDDCATHISANPLLKEAAASRSESLCRRPVASPDVANGSPKATNLMGGSKSKRALDWTTRAKYDKMSEYASPPISCPQEFLR